MDADKHIVRTRRLTKLGRRDAEYLGEIKSLPQGGRASCAGAVSLTRVVGRTMNRSVNPAAGNDA